MKRSHGMRTKHYIGSEPDLRIGNWLVEIKTGAQSIRNIRAELLTLAYWLEEAPNLRGLLVIVDTKITKARLEREDALLDRVLRPDIAERIKTVVVNDGRTEGLPAELDANLRQRLLESIPDRARASRTKPSHYAVLEILMHEWLLGHGPMTLEWIQRVGGLSYPSVASALAQFEGIIERAAGKKVRLRYFPSEEWAELVAVSSRSRSTVTFTDRSGNPRSPESLLRRLSMIDVPNVAVGGCFAARHYLPLLDLRGAPRLDLSVHGKSIDPGLIETLDPALERNTNKREKVSLAVHFVTRAEPFFAQGPNGIRYADPVECLLDLHEARLEPQAAELIEHFKRARRESMSEESDA